MIINWIAIYVLWLREMKRFLRATGQVVSTLVTPLLFLVSFGLGFGKASIPGLSGVNYVQFLVPGIIGMSLMMRSTMSGFSVLWDREFGFLKEIMVAPVNRVSIVFGRMAGGMTTSMIQATLVLIIATLIMGFTISNPLALIPTVIIMILISTTFLGIGLIFASLMKDLQSFNLITSLVVFPLFFMSGAFYPVTNLPEYIRWISYIDPLTYGVDALRGAFINASALPIMTDITILLITSTIMVALGTYLFEKSESV